MSFDRTTAITFMLFLCLDLDLAMNKSCTQDHDCLIGTNRQFCKDRICQRCINCQDYNRNTGLSSSCLKDVGDCGSCLDGYEEMKRRYSLNEKSCVKKTELGAVGGNLVFVEGSSERAPAHTTAAGVTIGIVVVAVGIVVGSLIGVYMYMKRSRIADAGKDDDEDGNTIRKPQVVELQTIVHANPNLARRQESEDRVDAFPTEISPITNNTVEENNENVGNETTTATSNNCHNDSNASTIIADEN